MGQGQVNVNIGLRIFVPTYEPLRQLQLLLLPLPLGTEFYILEQSRICLTAALLLVLTMLS